MFLCLVNHCAQFQIFALTINGLIVQHHHNQPGKNIIIDIRSNHSQATSLPIDAHFDNPPMITSKISHIHKQPPGSLKMSHPLHHFKWSSHLWSTKISNCWLSAQLPRLESGELHQHNAQNQKPGAAIGEFMDDMLVIQKTKYNHLTLNLMVKLMGLNDWRLYGCGYNWLVLTLIVTNDLCLIEGLAK